MAKDDAQFPKDDADYKKLEKLGSWSRNSSKTLLHGPR